MDFQSTKAWNMHQLAATENMQLGIERMTRPIVTMTGVSAMAYLVTWGPLWTFWNVETMPMLPLVVAILSALVLTLSIPAFVLAIAVESYIENRLKAAQGWMVVHQTVKEQLTHNQKCGCKKPVLGNLEERKNG